MTTVRAASQNSSSTGTAISVTAPTGTAIGDLVIVWVHGNGQTTITDNNGATPFTKDSTLGNYAPNTSSGQTVAVFYRRIQSGDPSTYNFTLGASGRWAAIAVACQNPHATDDFDVAPTTGTGASNRDSAIDGTAVTESITTLTDNALNFIMAAWDTASIGTITTPATYTLAANANGGGNPLHVSYKQVTPAGATGIAAVINTEFGAYITLSFAVKSEVGAAATFPGYIGRGYF